MESICGNDGQMPDDKKLTYIELELMYDKKDLVFWMVHGDRLKDDLDVCIQNNDIQADLLSDSCPVMLSAIIYDGSEITERSYRRTFGFHCLLSQAMDILDYVVGLNETSGDTMLFDPEVLKEAWFNACIHTDWKRFRSPGITIFDDRIEIISFRKGISRKNLRDSEPPNRVLMDAFHNIGLAHDNGYGVPLIINRYGIDAISAHDDCLTVTLKFRFESQAVKRRKCQTEYNVDINNNFHCSVPKIMEMGRYFSLAPMDQRTIEDSSMEWINEKTLCTFRNMFRQNGPKHKWLDEEDEEFLRLIGAANHSDGELKLTRAGLLMFGNITEISKHIPNYNLNYREYVSEDRWMNRIFSDSGLWSGNVFDFYLKVTRRLGFSNRKPLKLIGDVRTGDNDIIAIQKEALMNALVHADYSGAGGIHVDFYGTKLVVRNPGCFLIPIGKAMKGGYSETRNPLMMKMFKMAGLTERMGSGLITMMNTCRENHLPAPKIEEDGDPFLVKVTLALDVADVPLEEMILVLMERQPKISIDKMVRELGVSRATVSRSIDVLKANGRIRRNDGRRGT